MGRMNWPDYEAMLQPDEITNQVVDEEIIEEEIIEEGTIDEEIIDDNESDEEIEEFAECSN
jgi:hypothetical protein